MFYGVESPGPPSGSVILWDSLDSAVVTLTAVLFQQETEHNQQRKRCVGGGGSLAEIRAGIQGPLSAVTPNVRHSPAPALTPVCCCQTGTLIRGAVSRAFTGAGHPGSLGLGRLKIPEGKQMLSINHHVCTNTQGIVPRSFEFWEWFGTLPKSRAPAASQGPTF